MLLPKNICYEQLDHAKKEFPAFSPDYDEDDLGRNFELTVSLLGYQLDSSAIALLITELQKHIIANEVHKHLQ